MITSPASEIWGTGRPSLPSRLHTRTPDDRKAMGFECPLSHQNIGDALLHQVGPGQTVPGSRPVAGTTPTRGHPAVRRLAITRARATSPAAASWPSSPHLPSARAGAGQARFRWPASPGLGKKGRAHTGPSLGARLRRRGGVVAVELGVESSNRGGLDKTAGWSAVGRFETGGPPQATLEAGIWSSGTAALTAPAPSGRRTLVGLESEPIGTRSAGA
jgi:hypothetical protein